MARPARFDRSEVADAGLAVVADAGWPAVSMRSVATRLGVTPMSLYRVVADADALRDLVADAAAAPIRPSSGPGGLEAMLHAWAIDAHRHLAGLRGLATYVAARWTELPRWLDIVEQLLDAAEAEGITGEAAVAEVNAVFAYVLARSQFRDGVTPSRALRPMVDDPDRYPRMVANRTQFEVARVEPHFRYGLDALVAGRRRTPS